MTARSDGMFWLRESHVVHRSLAALILGLAALGAYHNSFSGALVFDDQSTIVENASIRQLWPLGPTLAPPVEAGIGGRPFANLTLALNYAVSGLDVCSYHALNLGLHVLAALALFGVIRRTLLQPALRGLLGSAAFPLALVAAGLWTVHPLQTSVVDYLSQRTEALMGLCYLLTLYCFIRSTEGTSRLWPPLTVVACLLGMASKEVMVTAPAMVFLYDRTFVAGTFRAAWRRRWRLYLALAASWFVLAHLMLDTQLAERGVGYALGVSWFHYALSECRAVVLYLRLALWPDPLVFDYGWAFVRSAEIAAPYVLVLGTLLTGTWWALWRRPVLGFAGGWFFGILAPSSSVVPVIQQPMAESRMYLPLAAVITLAVVGVYLLVGRRSWLGGLAVALGLGGITVQRNADYRSELTTWADTVAKCPENARAHNNLGSALLRSGRAPEALSHFEAALRIVPNYPEAHNNLGVVLLQAGRLPDAITHFQAALRVNPAFADAHYNLGEALLLTGRAPEAIAHLEAALRLRPDFAKAHNNLGVALLQVGRAREAILHDQAALRLQPDFAEAHYNLGNALVRTGRLPEAIAHFEAALRLRPDFAKAHNNLGVALLQAGRAPEAVTHFAAALRIDPDYAEARRNLDNTRAH